MLRPGGVTLVEMEPYGVGRVFRQNRCQCLLIRLPNGPDGAKTPLQLRLPLGAETGNAIQRGAHGALGVALVVIGDGKAVGLLLNLGR